MLRPRFYTTQPLAADTQLTLEKQPSRHIARALRMRVDDRLCLFDGEGREVAATITAINRDQVSVSLSVPAAVDRESPLQISLAIALSRGDRMDTVVQKATELGVQAIWPFISERTGVRLDAARLEKKHEHWQRIAISACEQSGRNHRPQISAVETFAQTLERAQSNDALKLILHPKGSADTLPDACKSLVLLIGPEGGFSDSEVADAADRRFTAFRLGPRVLRTETAPLASIAVAQARWGDFIT
jgi:16S rRNA (uracil1498-N3)-methyltransferase